MMRLEILGIPFDNISRTEALARVKKFIEASSPRYAVAINPEKIMKALDDSELKEILLKGDLNFVDGVGVAWASRLYLKEKVEERIAGIDLFDDIIKYLEESGLGVFLLGSKDSTIREAVRNIKLKYPKLIIKGFNNGYFGDENKVVEEISRSNAEVLFVGMGSPKQEKFIHRNISKFNVKFAMGIGGTFNVYAGEFKRAPRVIQKFGLEWLYRFILDPKRLPRILTLPKFILLARKKPIIEKQDVNFLGIKISNRNLSENLKILENCIRGKGFHLVVTLNGEMASRAISDKEFLDILKDSSLVIPDGVGVIWGARRFGERIKYRIPGIEFAWEVMRLSQVKGYSVYFLGASEDVLSKAVDKVKQNFPDLKIAGFHNGYFMEDSEILTKLRALKPDILFIGMGGIKQEKWIYKHKDVNIPVCIGVGGSFDIWSGRQKRAPYFIRRLGLEWLYRTITQPTRILRVKSLFVFAFKILFKRVQE